MLISGTVPANDGPGALMLKDLWSHYPSELLCGVFPQDPAAIRKRLDPAFSSVATTGIDVQFPRITFSKFGKIGRIVSQLAQDRNVLRNVQAFQDLAVALGRERKVDRVWALLDYPASCLVAANVARILGKPLYAYVQDDYRYLTWYFNLDPFMARRMAREVSAALRMSERCAVAGDSMGIAYRKEFGVTPVNLWHGVDESCWLPVRTSLNDGATLRIGFSGSVTAQSAFNCLLETLGELGWQVGGRQVKLTVMGNFFRLASSTEANVEYLGWQSLESTIRILHECDLLYLPQPFEPEKYHMTTLSFPVKLMTYLAAGRPIILHATQDASLMAFEKSRDIFAQFNQLECAGFSKVLDDVVSDPARYQRLASAGREALIRYFSKSAVRSLFAEFLGIN